MAIEPRPISGHVFKVSRKRGDQWYAKYRLPDGRQVQKRIGPHWSSLAKPAEGCFTKRSAEAWLDDVLARARRGDLPGMVRTGATFPAACDEWLDWKRSRGLKPSTLADYEHMLRRLKPRIAQLHGADVRLEELATADVERFRDELIADGVSDRTVNKYLGVLSDMFTWARRRYGLVGNAVAEVERRPQSKRGNIEVYSKEEVLALARAARDDQEATLYLTAAFTGLRRGELLALRWRDVDFPNATVHVRQNLTNAGLTTPKGGKERAVPLAGEVATALARQSQRDQFTADDDLVFVGPFGDHLVGRVVSRRFHEAASCAGLRRLRFHDLRHTFGTHAIRTADSREVMEWMGHEDLRTTQLYLQFKPKHDAARRLSAAFEDGQPDSRPAEPAPS
jgi:integrase